MKLTKTAYVYGFLTWLIPFVVAIPLMTPEGVPRVDIFLFKRIMLLVSTATGTYLLARLLGTARMEALAGGVKIGLLWLVINLGLDFAILIPMSGMGLREYIQSIGLGYITIPMIAAAMGLAITRSHEAAMRGH